MCFLHGMSTIKKFKHFTLSKYLFGSAKLTKNADLDKYTGYFIGFDSRSQFSFTDGSFGKHVIIFGADMSSSVHVDNRRKDILILGEGPTQGLDDTTVAAEAKYPINFTQSGKGCVLSVHCNGSKCCISISIKSKKLRNKRLCTVFR